MKIDILAFAAHPDDVELACAGTLLKHQLMGYTTGIIDLTRGELGSRGSAEIRATESATAAKILQLSVRENLGFADGFFKNDQEHLLPIIQMIRKYQPSIVFANAISDRHPDHARGSNLVSDACFYSGLIKVETRYENTLQPPHRPKVVYHYRQYNHIDPDFVVDISDFMDKKMASIECYSSQFFNPNSKEPETPISSKAFYKSITNRDEELGRIINVAYAEGFTTERYLGVNNLFDLI